MSFSLQGVNGNFGLDANGYCCGDSFTFSPNRNGGLLSNHYPSLFEAELRGSRCNIQMFNGGNGGYTSGMLLAVVNGLAAPARPFMASIYCGENDTSNFGATTIAASPSPSKTVFAVQAGQGQYNSPNSAVLINGESRLVASVATDTLTLSSALTNTPSAGDAVVQDTTTNIVAIGARLIVLGYTRLLVGTIHYFNWSSGGDTLIAQNATAADLRLKQAAAASTLGATVVDLYSYFRNRIVAGTDVQGSASWHVADLDSHPNTYGEGIIANAFLAAIPSSWTAALR